MIELLPLAVGAASTFAGGIFGSWAFTRCPRREIDALKARLAAVENDLAYTSVKTMQLGLESAVALLECQRETLARHDDRLSSLEARDAASEWATKSAEEARAEFDLSRIDSEVA